MRECNGVTRRHSTHSTCMCAPATKYHCVGETNLKCKHIIQHFPYAMCAAKSFWPPQKLRYHIPYVHVHGGRTYAALKKTNSICTIAHIRHRDKRAKEVAAEGFASHQAHLRALSMHSLLVHSILNGCYRLEVPNAERDRLPAMNDYFLLNDRLHVAN